ncbi:sulfite exporter TauE/SafE family protein [Methanobrevibacter sp. TMH8]|nr:sulfite exporter TauE/SafE family protein [Methanobrevibacter sp. TMH8]
MFSIEYIIFLIFIGVFAGISSGLLGLGGGFLMVPLQYFLLTSIGVDSDLALRISLGTSLAIIIPTSLSGAYTHQHRLENILKPGVTLGIFGIIGGILGGITSSYLPYNILSNILGIFLILIAITMLFERNNKNGFFGFKKIKLSLYIGAFFGILVGFSSGLLGIGGGIFLIPILVFLLGFSMKEAIGISSIFISLTAIGGAASYILTGWGINSFPFSLGYISLVNLGIIAIFSIPAAYIGAKLVYKIPEKRLKQIFGIIMIYMGIKMLGLDPISYLLGI